MSSKFKRVFLGILALSILALAVPTAQAGAQMRQWNEIPGYSNLRGYAIIEQDSGWHYGSRTVTGHVQLSLLDYSAYGRIQYAPVAKWARDGDWNTLPAYRGSGRVTLGWSDTFHLDYSGFKFRLCGAKQCGPARTIYF